MVRGASRTGDQLGGRRRRAARRQPWPQLIVDWPRSRTRSSRSDGTTTRTSAPSPSPSCSTMSAKPRSDDAACTLRRLHESVELLRPADGAQRLHDLVEALVAASGTEHVTGGEHDQHAHHRSLLSSVLSPCRHRCCHPYRHPWMPCGPGAARPRSGSSPARPDRSAASAPSAMQPRSHGCRSSARPG